jgi:hypothetical protein
MNLNDVKSDRVMLIALCNDHGLAVVETAFRREQWRARVLAIDRYVWVEDQEDLDWLSVDLTTGPVVDQYMAGAEAA